MFLKRLFGYKTTVNTGSICTTKPIEPQSKNAPVLKPLEADTFTKVGSTECNKKPHPLSHEELLDLDCALTGIRGDRYKRLPSTKHLSDDELKELSTSIHPLDKETFMLMSMGTKPAAIMYDFDILEKIGVDGFEGVDIHNNLKFVFNKKTTLENIEENKEFYIKRLDLPQDTSTEEIYQIFISENSPIKNMKDNDDLYGMLLGYPKKSSIMFHLERVSGVGGKHRENIPKLKKALKKALDSDKTPYSNFEKKDKKEIEAMIDSIEYVRGSSSFSLPKGYPFVCFGDESEKIAEISEKIRKTTAELNKIRTINRDEKYREIAEARQKNV